MGAPPSCGLGGQASARAFVCRAVGAGAPGGSGQAGEVLTSAGWLQAPGPWALTARTRARYVHPARRPPKVQVGSGPW
jgi:hypothetical protein